MKKVIKQFIPPIVLSSCYKTISEKYGFFGDYSSWDSVKKECSGYDSEAILSAVKNSCLKVKNKEAIYERDSVLFDKIEYSWAMLASLMYCATKLNGDLRVCDFGGSLGSSYFQNRKFLDRLDRVSWSIVEQKNFVDIGRAEFEDERLRFFYDIDECVSIKKPNVLLFSSVLQYIKNPYGLLGQILKYNFDFIIIDRTPFAKKDIIKKQVVPPSIYKASYPCWFFQKDKFVKYFKNKSYNIIEEFESLDGSCDKYKFEGMVMEKVKDV